MRGLAGKKKRLPADSPERLLKKILTKKELRHAWFNYFKKGILYISVDSSSWLYQLNLEKQGLLDKLSQKRAAIKDIRFSLGDLRDEKEKIKSHTPA